MRTSRILSVAVALGILSALFAGGVAQAATCAADAHPGGDWPSYGQNLSNTRAQAAEHTIDTSNVAGLTAAWTFSPADAGGKGAMQSVPVVAEGCLYVTTSAGYVYAINADTGALVWGARIAETVTGVCCGGTLFAPAVIDGVVYLNVSSNPATAPGTQGGPHVIAMDAQTGDELWRSQELAGEEGAYTNASAVYYDGMIVYGISNPENGFHEIGGFAIVDASRTCSADSAQTCPNPTPGGTGGTLLKRTYTVPDDQRAAGYAGGSIWSTAAVDTETGYGFAGTGQPSDWAGKESELVNAIVKFDLARARDAHGNPVPSSTITNPRFGEIVDARKGTADDTPYIDVDFAASPTLYKNIDGQKMVAEFQKSGWLHAAYTRHMSAAWSLPVAPFGTAAGNYASTATDGESIFAIGAFPGQIWSIDGTTGLPNWVTPVVTTLVGPPVSYANGVVYYSDEKGVLNGYDAATGLPVLFRPMSLDTPERCTNAGGGVTIARNTVYSVCGSNATGGTGNDGASGWLVAYRLP